MISAGDFRNGITIEYDNNVYQIIEFQHVKPGKGAAFVRTKLKNIKSGGVCRLTAPGVGKEVGCTLGESRLASADASSEP